MMILSADRLLPGPSGQVVDDGALLIEGDRIAAIGRRADVEIQAPAGTEHRRLDGATLLPGLINAHVHLAFDSSADPVTAVQEACDEELRAGMRERAQAALRSGCTTLRDLGDRGGLAAQLRDDIKRGDVPGPRILASGPPLTTPGGHCHFLGGEVDGPADIRQRVRELAELGVDFIKIMASGGQLTPGSPPMWQSQFNASELKTVVDEASRLGLPVAAHAHGTEAITDSVHAGVTTVEHCTWVAGEGQEIRRDEQVARLMASSEIAACAASSRNWRGIIDKMGKEAAEKIYGRLPWMDALGVPLITGTDAGLPRSPFDDLPGALQLYTYLGFEAADVLEMATTGTATALGLAERTGRLAAGLDADVLAVDGDPRDDLAVLSAVRLVAARGVVVE
ncbi:amidohydrolase family protein [Saccharopolyspora sp. NPDC049357]|uniref:amidohydrolase family protein n=1 Tax=Saccharopolyspora sp. NPDC049357 TaxID=3154507 RepID=UPI00342A4F93